MDWMRTIEIVSKQRSLYVPGSKESTCLTHLIQVFHDAWEEDRKKMEEYYEAKRLEREQHEDGDLMNRWEAKNGR